MAATRIVMANVPVPSNLAPIEILPGGTAGFPLNRSSTFSILLRNAAVGAVITTVRVLFSPADSNDFDEETTAANLGPIALNDTLDLSFADIEAYDRVRVVCRVAGAIDATLSRVNAQGQ